MLERALRRLDLSVQAFLEASPDAIAKRAQGVCTVGSELFGLLEDVGVPRNVRGDFATVRSPLRALSRHALPNGAAGLLIAQLRRVTRSDHDDGAAAELLWHLESRGGGDSRAKELVGGPRPFLFLLLMASYGGVTGPPHLHWAARTGESGVTLDTLAAALAPMSITLAEFFKPFNRLYRPARTPRAREPTSGAADSPGLASRRPCTPCGTLSRPISWRMDATSGRCRSFWGTGTSRPR